MSLNDIHSLSNTKWNCKYRIVFAPKYRRKVFYKEKREAIGKILRQLCEWKGINILSGGVARPLKEDYLGKQLSISEVGPAENNSSHAAYYAFDA